MKEVSITEHGRFWVQKKWEKFEQILKIAYLRLIFDRVPLTKSKPDGALGQFLRSKSDF